MEVENTPSAEQLAVEQEALNRFNQSKQDTQEAVTGQSEEVPEGYNPDGTPVEEVQEPILGKFKSQEDLITAYQELEKKLSSSTKEENVEPQKQEEVVDDKTVTKDDGTQFSIDKFDKEFTANGELSADSYKELEANGFTKDSVDRYIAGQQALLKQQTNAIYDVVGGEEAYTELVTWAGEGLPEATVTEYNEALLAGNVDKVTQLLEYMSFKRGTAAPTTPTRVKSLSGSDGGGMKAFTDKGEWQQATANPLYGKDVKYTNMIDKRYLASKRNGSI